MSLLWAAKAAKRKKAGCVAGSSRWVSNELNNQFMDSFNLIEEFYETVSSNHGILNSTMDEILLGTFNVDSITSTKSPIKNHIPQSISRAKTQAVVSNINLTPENPQSTKLTSHMSNDKSTEQLIKELVNVLTASVAHMEPTPSIRKDETSTSENNNDASFRVSDRIEDSFQAISKSIRKSIAERTTTMTVDHDRGLVSPQISGKNNQKLKPISSSSTTKSSDRLAISKRGRSSMFVALPPREPIVINPSSRSRKSTLKSRTTGNLPRPEQDSKESLKSPVPANSILVPMTNIDDLLDKFRISPVQLPNSRKFFYDTPQYTGVIKGSLDLKIDAKDDSKVKMNSAQSNVAPVEANNPPNVERQSAPVLETGSWIDAHPLNTPSKSPTEELPVADTIWDKIGRYRSLSPVAKPRLIAAGAIKSQPGSLSLSLSRSGSRSRSRSRSRSPIRREGSRTTTISGSPSRSETLQRRSRSPRRTAAIIDGEQEAVLVNRLTAPTSSSAAKTKFLNRKTIEGKKMERNRFLTATLIPATHGKGGNMSKPKDGSPIKSRTESHKFPKFDPGEIPKLKIPVTEKRNDTIKTKFIIKPLNRKSELTKMKSQIQNEPVIDNIDSGSKYQQEEIGLVKTQGDEPKSERRSKRVKTANGIALPEAARGILIKENTSKKHAQASHVTPTKAVTKKYPDILPATPTQISPGSLPTILSDDDLIQSNKKVLQSWAHTPVLRRTIMNSRAVDPTTVFNNNPKIDLKETFKNEESVHRGEQSPFPTPNPKQREKEAKRYTQQMGYIP